MYRKSLRGDRHGVAGAVATMFVLLIILLFISIYAASYVPVYARNQENSHMQQLYEQFSSYQLQNYNMESGGWPYPVTTTMNLGTPGIAPFAQPTSGSLVYSSSAFSASISYKLGVPVSLPSCQHDYYENLNSSNRPTHMESYFTESSTFTGPTVTTTNPNHYGVPAGSVACYVVNSSYINSTDFDIFLGSTTSHLNNFTLIVSVYGNHNAIDFFGYGDNLTIWYISYGAYNQMFDNSNNFCGFEFSGHNDIGYVQDYGRGDVAPFGWPHFQASQQYYSIGGSLAATVYNQYYTPQTLVYQGGAVILSQHNSSIMQNGPEFSAVNSSSTGADISLNLISLIGSDFTLSGNGPVSLTNSYFSGTNTTVGQYQGMNRVNVLNLTISSSYASAWASYFASKLTGLQNVTANPLVALVGNGCYDASGFHVPWGAYALTVSGSTLHLSLFNIANLNLGIGELQTTAGQG